MNALPSVPGSAAERLARRLVATASGCLEWTGYTFSGGYGQMHVNAGVTS